MRIKAEHAEKIALTIKETTNATGISAATIHKLCNEGHLIRRKVGKRTFILIEDLVEFFRTRDSTKWGADTQRQPRS